MPNFLVAALASSVRFSVGWYAARGFALIASSTLLCVLLAEMTVLYSRLASAIALQRREHTNRMMSIDAATAAIAHEVRQPLGAIALNASTALSKVRSNPPDMEDLAAILEDINDGSQRAGAIISSVRDLFGGKPDQKIPIRTADAVQQAIRLLQHDLANNQVSINIDCPETVPPISGDPVQIQQVLLNLIKNALDAMASVPPERRTLVVSSRSEAARVMLSIRDSGVGIPIENQSRVFEPFFSTKYEGMGLGLAVCRMIIERHGGDLRLIQSDGTGSVIEVALPAAR
jgi:signal transduction histidine kinase